MDPLPVSQAHVVFPLPFPATAHQFLLLTQGPDTPGRSWGALGSPRGGKATIRAAKREHQLESLSKMPRSDQQVLVGPTCKVCVQREQEKRETDFSLGKETAR